ncbi:hypothetical protein C5167_031861 [Papaver somniferum]|uniref:Uncharacterized protein n=1 Tax=Papaver somniferum TaxID=3469 RepID=A0A4Y7K877_PAPSO|nr:hypothetical protein C5167_031861 [Papaver somniferum]
MQQCYDNLAYTHNFPRSGTNDSLHQLQQTPHRPRFFFVVIKSRKTQFFHQGIEFVGQNLDSVAIHRRFEEKDEEDMGFDDLKKRKEDLIDSGGAVVR